MSIKYKNLIVNNLEEFETTKKIIATLVDINSSLPQQVFKQHFKYFKCEEFEWALSSEFWEVIQFLGKLTNEKELIIGMIEPSPLEYFLEEFGYYNWFKVPISMTTTEYSSFIEYGPESNHLGALLYYSETIVWAPLSGKWAIWGQRAYGVCIVAFSDPTLIKDMISLPGIWRPASEALEDFICLNFENQQLPEQFAREFLLNYSNK